MARQLDDYFQSVFCPVVQTDIPTMRTNDIAGNTQTQAAAARIAIAGHFGTEKGIEDFFEQGLA